MSESETKSTIYIEADDEITAIIDKTESAKAKLVALVLPKRSTTLQSIINLRLLKKSAEAAGKQLVLISEDANLRPLADAAGLAVAKNLRSRPELPTAPDQTNPPETDQLDYSAPIGELAVRHAEDTAEVVPLADAADKTAKPASKLAKPVKEGGLKIPNFDRFRLLLIGGITAFILLIIGLILATTVLPKATVTVQITGLPVTASLSLTAEGNAKSIDQGKAIMPASLQTHKKSQSQSVTATGQQNQGDKATGTMTIYYCPNNDNTSVSLPAGSGFINNGLVFRTASAVTVPASNFTGSGTCKKDVNQTASVTADKGGASYNIGSRTYTSTDHGDVTGSGSAMSGGSDKNVTVLAQSDVDGVAAKMAAGDAAVQTDFQKQLEAQGLYIFSSTLNLTKANLSASPTVGAAASTATVSREITFTALTVKKADLNKFIAEALNKQIDPKRQKLSTEDLISASQIQVVGQAAPTNASLSIAVNTTAVPLIDTDALKKQITGKKDGEVRSTVSALPGVKSVNVKYSPFWVSKAPKPSKITIVQQQISDKP